MAEHDNQIGELGTTVGAGLTLAVLYHGLSCLADNSVPANSDTVLRTAIKFTEHLDAHNRS
jgi:hypothetical protein